MGARTLVVVARDDDRFDCRLAHWGVDADPLAQSRPLAAGLTPAEVRDVLDATVETLVVLDGAVCTYCVCWLDPTLSDPDDVAVARTGDPGALRDWWTGAKSHASGAVAAGLPPPLVRAGLLGALYRRAEVVHVDDASFLRDDR
ncbi:MULTISPECIES: hypothetical protein [Haloarcula]|uniref:hypothetical protein n=1 Tax=Haloarcula TaxID=2237 RepID=UPI0023EDB8B9|nr:hypothetical protein [Halomicroarcula sp. XH51]